MRPTNAGKKLRGRRLLAAGNLRRVAVWCALTTLVMSPTSFAQDRTTHFDIREQKLPSALLDFGRQAGISIIAPNDLVTDQVSPALQGDFTPQRGLSVLLSGTGLRFEFVTAEAVRIYRPADPRIAPVAAHRHHEIEGDADRVVVTGTTISGLHPESSPFQIYTQNDFAELNATTAEEFLAGLPQNAGTISRFAPSVAARVTNLDAVSSADFRGLGAGATLTLLNGRRLARSHSGQSVDVSLIPLDMIQRVEVLKEGASTAYGSDAIGGVINFILQDSLEGAESRFTFATAHAGQQSQATATHKIGAHWPEGRGLLAYSALTSTGLAWSGGGADSAAEKMALAPADTRHHVFGSWSERASEQASVHIVGGYAWRKVKHQYLTDFPDLPQFSTQNSYASRTAQWFVEAEFDFRFSDHLASRLAVSHSRVDVDGGQFTTSLAGFAPFSSSADFDAHDAVSQLEAKLEGDIASPGMPDLRFSLGVGLLAERFRGVHYSTHVQSGGEIGRLSPFNFFELNIPFVEEDGGILLARRFEVNLAGRYTAYQDDSQPELHRDFGASADPKVGFLWSPVAGVSIKATYGTSFRAPSLTQIDPTSASYYLANVDVDGLPATVLGLVSYAASDLDPERAQIRTMGVELGDDRATEGMRLALTHYDIRYQDRIGVATTSGYFPFQDPARSSDVIYRPPSAAFIEQQLRGTSLFDGMNATGLDLSDPVRASLSLFARKDIWIYDLRERNLGSATQQGIDVSLSAVWSPTWGTVRAGLDMTKILSFAEKDSPAGFVRGGAGVEGRPADDRGRAYLGFSSGGWNGDIAVSYVADYSATQQSRSPRIKRWATCDARVSVSLMHPQDGGSSATVSLMVTNLFDKPPPTIETVGDGSFSSNIGFDPVNANPLGRVITLSVATKW